MMAERRAGSHGYLVHGKRRVYWPKLATSCSTLPIWDAFCMRSVVHFVTRECVGDNTVIFAKECFIQLTYVPIKGSGLICAPLQNYLPTCNLLWRR